MYHYHIPLLINFVIINYKKKILLQSIIIIILQLLYNLKLIILKKIK